jgi:hypothetical protein
MQRAPFAAQVMMTHDRARAEADRLVLRQKLLIFFKSPISGGSTPVPSGNWGPPSYLRTAQLQHKSGLFNKAQATIVRHRQRPLSPDTITREEDGRGCCHCSPSDQES